MSRIATAPNGHRARQLVSEQDFDLVIINAPLKDESGEKLSCHIISKQTSQVLLIVKNEYYEEISSIVENEGVITISKPLNRDNLWFSLKLAKAAHNRIKKIQKENIKLVEKIEDIKIVARAKSVLISYLNMSEVDAHKYIEREAMDNRTTRRTIAEGVLKTYENK